VFIGPLATLVMEYVYSLDRIADRLRSGGSGDRFLVHTSSHVHPTTCSMSTGDTGGDVDHSPFSSAVVKNAWGYTFTPSVYHHGVTGKIFP